MTYRQVRDVVDQLRGAHQRLRNYLEEPRSRADDKRTQRMLEALRQDEQEFEVVLAKYERHGEGNVLETWLQYIPDEELERVMDTIDFEPEMSAEEVLARKQEFDKALIALYYQLEVQTSVPGVEEFFRTLREQTENRTEQRSWEVREYQADGDPPPEA